MDLQSLNLKEKQLKKVKKAEGFFTKAFWKRQFQVEATQKQKVFDWTFGVILPVICFLFDPIVFGGSERAIFWQFKPFAYSLSFISIITLLAFLLFGKGLKGLNAFVCGLFVISSVISLGIGIILLPFSLIGLFLIVGILGFTPLFTAFVFGRNAVRAFRLTSPISSKSLLVNAVLLSAIFSFAVPYMLNIKVQRGLESIEEGDVQTIQRTTDRLSLVSPLINPAVIQRSYNNEHADLERKAALRESYKTLSGNYPVNLPYGEVWD